MTYSMEKIKYMNHPIPMIGRVWVFPEVTYVKDPEGELGISMAELQKLQHAVANAICGEHSQLSCEEFDFLMDLSESTVKEISTLLICHSSNIGRWRNKDHVPPLESIVLKEYFWVKLFGDLVDYPKSIFGKERLRLMSKAAVEKRAAISVSKKAA
jgi:hypothetical protein